MKKDTLYKFIKFVSTKCETEVKLTTINVIMKMNRHIK